MALSKKTSAVKDLRPLLQPDESLLTISYQPAGGQSVAENPPRFQWIPPQIGAHQYELEVSGLGAGDPAQPPTVFSDIRFPFYTPESAMAPGRYRWRYRTVTADGGKSEWSAPRDFDVPEDAAVSPSVFDYATALQSRPRLAIAPNRHEALSEAVELGQAWTSFVAQSVEPWLEKEPFSEPARYPNDIRTAKLWRESYIRCQEMLYAIRNLAISGVLTKNKPHIAAAKAWLLELASWDPEGSTSRSYNDEAAFRCATALAWGYDWLSQEMSEDECGIVRTALLERGRQVARHVMQSSRIDTFPYDSHAVRAVSAVLLPVGLALAGEDAEGDLWLEFAVSYLIGPFSAWGDSEGGWAEGIHYWTTAMSYALEAITILRNLSGLDLFARPFFRRTGQFPMYCRPAWTTRGTFGDDSTLGDAPSPKIAKNMRLLACATKIPEYAGYAEQIASSTVSDPRAYYNYGWWDFAFDDLLVSASFDPIEGVQGPRAPSMQVFPEVGWASLQARMDDPREQIHCVFKSSSFGALSHSHADQNAFCLSAFGQDLLVQSGYYVAHNSSMHRDWRRQTRSKNALLLDGCGQYAGSDKFLARKASGAILCHGADKNHLWCVGDATKAYHSMNSQVSLVQRHMHLVFGAAVIVVDFVECAAPVPVTWLGHTFGSISVGELAATINTETADLGVEVIFSAAGVQELRHVEGFEGVDPGDFEGLDVSRRLEIALEPKRHHVLATMLTPLKKGGKPQVHCFVDDQGFGKTLYCLHHDDDPVRISLQKTA